MERTRNTKRDMLDIIMGILEVANEPVKKTHILYAAGINFYQLSRYLTFLVKLNLIEEITEPYVGYRTTEKGRACMSLFNFNETPMTQSPATTSTNSRIRSLRVRGSVMKDKADSVIP